MNINHRRPTAKAKQTLSWFVRKIIENKVTRIESPLTCKHFYFAGEITKSHLTVSISGAFASFSSPGFKFSVEILANKKKAKCGSKECLPSNEIPHPIKICCREIDFNKFAASRISARFEAIRGERNWSAPDSVVDSSDLGMTGLLATVCLLTLLTK